MFTFTGIETITSGSEEAKQPSRTTPSAITYSVYISSVVYFCVSTAATLSLHKFPGSTLAVLPEVLQTLNVHGASAVICIGGLLGLLASLVGVSYSVPRLLYAFSYDRMLCKVFSGVSSKGRLTVLGSLLCGCVVATVSLLLRTEILLHIVSIGTLLAYIAVAISVICMRYQPGTREIGLRVEYDEVDESNFMQCTDFTYANFQLDASKSNNFNAYRSGAMTNQLKLNALQREFKGEKTRLTNGFGRYNKSFSFDDKARLDKALKQSEMYNSTRDNTYTRLDSVISSTSNGSISGLLRLPSDIALEPTEQTWRKVKIGLVMFLVCSLVLCVIQTCVSMYLNSVWILVIIIVSLVCLTSAMVLVARQPQNRIKFYSNTPYVPFVPLLSIVLNTLLLASLPVQCWIRFSVWMCLGEFPITVMLV